MWSSPEIVDCKAAEGGGSKSGEGDAYYVKFYQRAACPLYHRVLERMGGLVDKIHISCCAAGMRRFVAYRTC